MAPPASQMPSRASSTIIEALNRYAAEPACDGQRGQEASRLKATANFTTVGGERYASGDTPVSIFVIALYNDGDFAAAFAMQVTTFMIIAENCSLLNIARASAPIWWRHERSNSPAALAVSIGRCRNSAVEQAPSIHVAFADDIKVWVAHHLPIYRLNIVAATAIAMANRRK